MNLSRVFVMAGFAVCTLTLQTRANPPGLALVERMPRQPQPWSLVDWRAKARDFDRLAFDEHAAGQYLPLVQVREKGRNIAGPVFSLPTFVGAPASKSSEAITCLAAVAGGLLMGIDKTDQNGRDWVAMCLEWYSPEAGVVVNNSTGKPGNSFWYDLFSAVLFFELADLQPGRPDLNDAMCATADRWHAALVALGGPKAEFDHTAFRFSTMAPHDNGKWREPDAAAGLAWLMHAAWRRFEEPRFLEAARWCVDYLQRWNGARGNPGYEVLHYFAPVVAARLNLEAGGDYDVGKMLAWSFSENLDRPTARPNWGMIAERWGGYDVHGLLGSTRDGGGYAFAMNTFHAAAVLAPVARYQPGYARVIGRWLVNVANNARLFYPEQWPPDRQSSAAWSERSRGALAYEGLRKHPRVLAENSERIKTAPNEERWVFSLPAGATQATAHCSATADLGPSAATFVIECDEGAGFRPAARWPGSGTRSGGKRTATFVVLPSAKQVTVRVRPVANAEGEWPDFHVSIRCFLESSPFATGDSVVLEWGSATDFGVYGSAHVGFLAAVVEATNVPGTVRTNLTATDFFRAAAYPTWLYYNPGERSATFFVEGPETGFDLYDAVKHRFIGRNAKGRAEFSLEPDVAAVVVAVPAGRGLERVDSVLKAGGVIIDPMLPPDFRF